MNNLKKSTFMMVSIFTIIWGCTNDRTFVEDTSRDSKTDTSAKPDGDMGKNDGGQGDDMGKDGGQTSCDPACGGGKVCNLDDFSCVDCLSDDECGAQKCNTSTHLCVDCLENTTCTEAGASACMDGACAACTVDADCTHIAGLPRCDAGTCKVECEADSDCAGGVCDFREGATKNTCNTDVMLNRGQCEACVSDGQCKTGYHCMPMGFGSPNPAPHGNYCLPTLALGACVEPYLVDINRMSLNGAAAESHCGVNEKLTTCEAVLSALGNQDCKDDADAMVADPSKCFLEGGGRCEKILGNWTCTYNCNDSRQCSSSCNLTDGYCQ